MARHFDNNTANYLSRGAETIPNPTGVTYSISAWFRRASTQADAHNFYAQAEPAGNNFFGLAVGGDEKVAMFSKAGGVSAANATTTTTTSVGVWHHCCGVQSSATLRTAYLDGGGSGTSTESQNPGTLNTTVGILLIGGSAFSPADGDLGEVAVWSGALSAGEVLALARGASPLVVQPSSLLAYWPIIGVSSPEPDRWRGLGLTINGTVAAAGTHPPMQYPKRRQAILDYHTTAVVPAPYYYSHLAGGGSM